MRAKPIAAVSILVESAEYEYADQQHRGQREEDVAGNDQGCAGVALPPVYRLCGRGWLTAGSAADLSRRWRT
jgi:hypothetical protein